MRARAYGVVVLAVAGLVPVGIFGYFAVTRSERASIAQVRASNGRVARLVAERVGAYLASERHLLQSIGTAALLAEDADSASAVLDAYALSHQYLHEIQVYRKAGAPWAAERERSSPAAVQELVRKALAGHPARTSVVPADPNRAGPFAHTMTLAEPVVIAGRQEGAIVARMDLVGIWPPIHAIQMGKTGFVRLLTAEGELLAHGDPEERRFVFSSDRDAEATLIAAALLGRVAPNHQGEAVLTSLAVVPGIDWIVVVEQSVEEAHKPASILRRALLGSAAIALLAVVLFGVLLGRSFVRGLEALRAHTRVIAGGDLDARVEPPTRLAEVQALARALNDMAASLQELQEEARARDRMTTFARISAGLAHDLKAPIEAIRGACLESLRDPTDEAVRALMRRVSERDLPRLKSYMDDLHRLAARGELDLNLVRTDPGELARDVLEDLRANLKWDGVSFLMRGQAEPLAVDRGLVSRALYNLAANAADACLEAADEGTVTIEVEESRDALSFCVRDTGSGISQDRVRKLGKVDFASTKRSTGVGLGLGVVRQVAAAHRGRLDISSELGSGSTFTLVLPRSGGTRPASEQRAP